VINVLMTAAF